MVRVGFDMEKLDYDIFKFKVGAGNISTTLRNYALSFVTEHKPDEKKLHLEFIGVEREKEKIIEKLNTIKIKIEGIDFQRKQEEKQKEEFMAEQKSRYRKAKNETFKTDLHRVLDEKDRGG